MSTMAKRKTRTKSTEPPADRGTPPKAKLQANVDARLYRAFRERWDDATDSRRVQSMLLASVQDPDLTPAEQTRIELALFVDARRIEKRLRSESVDSEPTELFRGMLGRVLAFLGADTVRRLVEAGEEEELPPRG